MEMWDIYWNVGCFYGNVGYLLECEGNAQALKGFFVSGICHQSQQLLC